MTDQIHRILTRVQKPARYVGGEYNQIVKRKQDVDVRVAFCFPDTYEIGMSNIGMRILYGVMNEMPGVWCERVFAPWGDMEAEMRAHRLPLWALESHDPVRDFDLVAFTLGYEMCYSNVLNMLELSGLPLLAKDRKGLEGIVFAGGVCTVNPEPLADFIDFFSIGEGEESTREIIECYRAAKRQGLSKQEFLREAAKLEGVYVPSLYTHTYNPDGTLAAITPAPGAPARVKKRIVQDLDRAYFPTKTIVPSTQIVHDRSNLEIFRGCIRGCRFCQAGFCYRPIRAKSADTLCRQAIESLEDSGNSEITLASLSTSDYRELEALADGLLRYCEPRKINLSLPSLRADNFSRELMLRIQKVRKSGLTFAPEAGTQRLRDAINKNVTEEEILSTCATAFSGGWNSVKLYFMLGLPTETDEDVIGIAELVYKILQVWRENGSGKKRGRPSIWPRPILSPSPSRRSSGRRRSRRRNTCGACTCCRRTCTPSASTTAITSRISAASRPSWPAATAAWAEPCSRRTTLAAGSTAGTSILTMKNGSRPSAAPGSTRTSIRPAATAWTRSCPGRPSTSASPRTSCCASAKRRCARNPRPTAARTATAAAPGV